MRCSSAAEPGSWDEGRRAYLELLKKTLIRFPMSSDDVRLREQVCRVPPAQLRAIDEWIARSLTGAERPPDLRARSLGQDWPETGESMIGLERMDNLQACLLDIIANDVDGDLAETGVWRGGAVIFMCGVTAMFDRARRSVWVADSFEGLPRPDPATYPADAHDMHWTHRELAVPRAEVEANFARYGLLDDRVRFLAGWFRDSLPSAPIEKLALLRLDGDMYESTAVALRALHPKVQRGGYVIVDDYHALAGCRQAVDDYRRAHGILAPLQQIDWTGVMWQVN